MDNASFVCPFGTNTLTQVDCVVDSSNCTLRTDSISADLVSCMWVASKEQIPSLTPLTDLSVWTGLCLEVAGFSAFVPLLGEKS